MNARHHQKAAKGPRTRAWLLACLTLLLSAADALGQGTFQNLNFESTLLPAGGASTSVSASAAFPDWNVFIGTNAQSTVLYNDATLGNSSVALLAAPGYPSPIPVFGGNFSALLVCGATGTPSLNQTGLVPANAKSLLLYGMVEPEGGTSSFSVSLGGQIIQMVSLQPIVNYTYALYSGDISSFAGQNQNVQITALYQAGGGVNPFAFDNIQFSDQPSPEPGVLALSALGALLLGWRVMGGRR